MLDDKVKLSQLRKQNKKLREKARQAEANVKDDFLNFRGVFQEMGQLLGLEGTFVAHFGTDHILGRLESIMAQMDKLEACLFLLAKGKSEAADMAYIARFILGDHYAWKQTLSLEDTYEALKKRKES